MDYGGDQEYRRSTMQHLADGENQED